MSLRGLYCREDYRRRVTFRITIRVTREIAEMWLGAVRTNAIDITKEWETIECFARNVGPLAVTPAGCNSV